MRKFIFSGVSLTAILFSFACAKPMVAPESDRGIETGLLLPYILEAKEAVVLQQGCDFMIRKEGSGEIYSLQLKMGGKRALVEIPQGRYHVSKLSCPYQRSWAFDDSAFPPVTVFDKKVSLAGPLKISVPEEPGILTFGRLAGDEAFTLTQASYLGIPIVARSKLVSSVTGIAILSQMLQRPKKSVTWMVSPLERNDREMKDSSSPDFQSCMKEEGAFNWLWLGEMKASAIYDGHKLTKLDFERSPNTFTQRFGQCIAKRFEDFKPPYPGKVKYDLTL